MTTKEIADLVQGELEGSSETEIDCVADFSAADEGAVAFLEKLADELNTSASCVLLKSDLNVELNVPTIIRVANPKLAFALVAERLHPPKPRAPEIHESAVISLTAKIG